MSITITLNDEEVKTVLDALKVSRDELQAQANSVRPRAKRCGITKAGWQRLADNNRKLIDTIEKEAA